MVQKKSVLLLEQRKTFAERTRIEQQHGNGSAADSRIGQVEDGTEENEMLACHERHPRRPVELEQREVEHVHHTPVQPVSITLPRRHERGNAHPRALAEDGAVEDAVDDIAHRPCKNQCDAHDVTHLEVRLGQPPDVPQDDTREHQPHQRLHRLGHHLHAEGHAVVLDESNVEPVRDADALPVIHVGLHLDLDKLVQKEGEHNDAHRQPESVVFLVHNVRITHKSS